MAGVTPVDDLGAWLTQVWDEQEKAAHYILDGGHWRGIHVDSATEVAVHIEAWNPASVLARIAADRQILALHTGVHECPFWDGHGERWEDLYCPTALLLATAHADRPGFQKAWWVTDG